MTVIKLKLRNIHQLFNSMDPSPFPEKDLDDDAEDFIVSWAREVSFRKNLSLKIILTETPNGEISPALIQEAIHHYFAYRADMAKRDFRHLLKEGRISLGIGLAFLFGCLGLVEVLGRFNASYAPIKIFEEGLYICGWVAMWRPIQTYLYDWWPVQRRVKTYKRLMTIKVDTVVHQNQEKLT